MTNITESRLVKISKRIITTADLSRLANALAVEHEAWIEENGHVRLSFTARSDDGSEYESEDPSLFSDESPIHSKRIVSTEMYLRAYETDRSVAIDLQQTGRYGFHGNSISCKGSDSKWVNGMLATLQDIVDGFAPQNQFVRTNRWWIQTITAIGIGVIFTGIAVEILSLIGVPGLPPDNPIKIFLRQYPIVRLIILYVAYWFIGGIPASLLMNRLEDLWPRVEFQVGPPHKHAEKRKRSTLTAILVLGVIPFIVQLVSDLGRQLGFLGG